MFSLSLRCGHVAVEFDLENLGQWRLQFCGNKVKEAGGSHYTHCN